MCNALSPITILISVVMLFWTASAAAQTSGQSEGVAWVIDGNITVLPDQYTEREVEDPGDAVLMYLGDRGFLNAVIDSVITNTAEVKTIFYVSSGCRYTVANVSHSVTGDAASGNDMAAARDNLPGQIRGGEPFSADLVDLERRAISDYFVDSGYLLVTVSLKEPVFPRECEVNLHFETDTGKQVRISGHVFPDIQRNNPEFLNRVASIPDSAVADRSTIKKVIRNLQQSGLFERVDEPGIMLVDDRFYLVHELKERRTNVLDLLLGYVPGPSGGGDIAGTGTLRIRNAVWDGSMLFLRFERLSPLVTRFMGEFQQRWMFGVPLSSGGAFRFIQQDSTYQLRNVRFEAGYAIGGGLEVFGAIRREASSSNKGTAVPVKVLDGTTLFGGLGVRADTRDDILVPTSGVEFNLELGEGIKRIDDDRAVLYTDRMNFRQRELSGYVRPYFMPFRRQVVAPSLNGFLKISPEFTESDLFRTGGANSLRGYREDQFLVSRLIWGDLEYRYLLDRTSYAFVFFAAGWYHRPGLVVEPDGGNSITSQIHSGGFGFSYRTPVGQLRFSYAISAEDTFSNGKVHFGLVADL